MLPTQTKPPLLWVNVIIFIGLPMAALILLPLWGVYHGFDAFQWLWAVGFLYLNGMSITGGYHRLWAHKAYEASTPLKWFFAFWGAGALQNSILIWASDHRRHHRHVDDNVLDPYCAGRGLWFSHIGWMLREYRPNVQDFSNARDLLRDPVVIWQDRRATTERVPDAARAQLLKRTTRWKENPLMAPVRRLYTGMERGLGRSFP